MSLAQSTLYRVLESARGRHSLWPAAKAAPAGWREALGACSKDECLAFVRRAPGAGSCGLKSTLRPAHDPNMRERPQADTVQFSLMFFGGDEGKMAQDK